VDVIRHRWTNIECENCGKVISVEKLTKNQNMIAEDYWVECPECGFKITYDKMNIGVWR
jgi:DNA-directed RNA polymerase subunit RPC12/RpoP